jgi:hypothetical protein
MFCSQKCNSNYFNVFSRQEVKDKINKKRGHSNGGKRDQYTPFRWYMKVITSRCKTSDKSKVNNYNVDIEYIKEIWDQQDGKCALTNIPIVLRTHTNVINKKADPYSASIDRIDNSKGYIKGNIRFVSLIVNYAKNAWKDEDLINFILDASRNIKT